MFFSRFPSIVFLCALCSWAQVDSTGTEQASTRTVYVIPVGGAVEPGLAAFISRALRDAGASRGAMVVLEMDTFGGRVDAALEIVDTLLRLDDLETVAFVKKRAISAGALIALACETLVMREGTTIGDCEPISYSSEGPKSMGEKFQSPLRARFRALARRNGYPIALSESMVSKDMVVYEVVTGDSVMYLDSLTFAELPAARKADVVSKRTVVAAGKLLTMDDVEARELGFSRMSVESIEAMLDSMKVGSYEIVRLSQSWSERFVRLLTRIAPVLMMIGLAALYTELRSPGFGIPGIVGITALALVFMGQYAAGLADYTELLLIVLGIVLLAVELFVTPGLGLMGIAGVTAIAAGMVLSLQGFVLPKPSMPWQAELFVRNIIKVLAAFIGSFVIAMGFLRYIFPRVGAVISGPYLAARLEGHSSDGARTPVVAVGDEGTVTTPLRPAGKARIGGMVIDVVAESEYVDSGETVRVVKKPGSRIVVARKEPDEQ